MTNLANRRNPPYNVARLSRPRGVCYCDLDDEACYNAGHWSMRKTKVEIEILDRFQKTVEARAIYRLPEDGASRAICISSAVEMLMDSYSDWTIVNIQISKDDEG